MSDQVVDQIESSFVQALSQNVSDTCGSFLLEDSISIFLRSFRGVNQEECERFLSYLIRFTCKQFGRDVTQIPPWWTETVFYHPDFARGLIPTPETRNKNVKLRRLIKLCYLHYNCKSLLIMSEQLATQQPENYKFIQEPSGDVAVYRVKTMTVMVRIPPSNLDYAVDSSLPRNNLLNGHVKHEVSITRRPLLSPAKKAPTGPAEVIVLDSSSDSDDEVQIVSYEPGALPPTPPKIRPGPACSKIRPAPRPFIGPASVQQRLTFGVAHRTCQLYRPAYLPQRYQPYRHPPPQQSVPARSKYLQCRPRRNIKIEHVDLTVDDDEEDGVVQPTLPQDLSQSDFLARMGLATADSAATPKTAVPSPPVILKNKRLNVRDIPCTMIPYLVNIGYLPRRALCTPAEVDKRTGFIDKHTARDTNWFRVTVNTRDKAAVEKATRKCSVRVKRLNSADMRRWRR